jgi:hypothetical protein
MRRRNGAVVQTGLLLLAAFGLAVGPAAVVGVSVAQACVQVSCFSGVVAACGSCLPAQADAVSGRQHSFPSRQAAPKVAGQSPRIAGSTRHCSPRSHLGSNHVGFWSDMILAVQRQRQQPRESPGISCVNRLRGLSGTSPRGASGDAAELGSCSIHQTHPGLRAAVRPVGRSLSPSKLTRAPEAGMAVVRVAGLVSAALLPQPVSDAATLDLSSFVMLGSCSRCCSRHRGSLLKPAGYPVLWACYSPTLPAVIMH